MTHVLVVNSGSSSIKYRLLELPSGRRAASGLVESIGEPGGGGLTHTVPGAEPYRRDERYPDHEAGFRAVLAAFSEAGPDLGDVGLAVIGHRVVHGGKRFGEPVRVDDGVLDAIRELAPLAPLHNPACLEGIEVAQRAFPDVPHVAVFDTAFHRTLPAAAHTYAVPREWTRDHDVRRYGFHGTSYAYVSRRAAALLGRDPAEVNLVVLHLGNGASAAAVEGGRSVDTSMGLTPLEGLVMGTRSGDVDPSLPAYLARTSDLTPADVDTALNKKSGLLGLAGANDLREVWRAADRGDDDARLAIDVYCHRLKKYVGGYLAVLGRTDAVVFTAGVGENDHRVRAQALAGLERLGITVDARRNTAKDNGERVISPAGAEIPVLVIPTDEELEIATQSLGVIGGAD